MRKPVVAGNWKMNGSLVLCERFATDLETCDGIDVWLFPSSLHLARLTELLASSKVETGAQNVWFKPEGAFTGEASAKMVAELGAMFALVGHSERRAMFGDADEITARKFTSIVEAGLTPVLCVGETLEERDSGRAFDAVARQLNAIEKNWEIGGGLRHQVIAYEPVWAIGTGRTASADIAQEMHAKIREYVCEKRSGDSREVRILYGGSVKANNAAELIQQEDIDGFLVGGASLEIEEFQNICEAVKN